MNAQREVPYGVAFETNNTAVHVWRAHDHSVDSC